MNSSDVLCQEGIMQKYWNTYIIIYIVGHEGIDYTTNKR